MGPENSKPAGFVADGQFQPKCLGSEFSRQIAVDFESNANLHKRGGCPRHSSHLPFLSEERQTYSGPFQVARSAGRDMRQLPCGRIDCGVPERVRPMCLSARSLIDESALIAALLDAPSEGGHHQYFKVAIRRPVHVCPDIPRVSGDTLEIVLILGLNQQPARSGPSGCSLRGCSSSRVPPPGVNSFAPAALFLGIGLFAPPSARAATWQS